MPETPPGVTLLRLRRPERRNAIDRAAAEALATEVRSFEADPDARVAVLVGEGASFCAGADLQEIAAGRPNRVEPDGDGPLGPTRMFVAKPVIAAIEGYAVAGGLELALWCDLRVAAEDAVLGVYCRRWGVPLIDGGTVRLPRLIGQSRALDLILTGRPVGAAEALQMGLVNRVVPPGQALVGALELAAQLAALPQVCLRNDRSSVYEQWDLSFPAAMENELRLGMESLGSGMVEGVGRFVSGRRG